MLSPIVIFTYNRPWHTQQTVEALRKNSEAGDSDLIVYSDGAKDNNDAPNVAELRRYIHSIQGFKSVRIIEREQNLGLSQSIITGVTEIVNEFGRVIVLEDDLLTSPFFLRYMNDGLKKYEKEDRVISINAYCYPQNGLPETFFLKGADCWGWATWKAGWQMFEADGKKLLFELKQKKLLDRFNFFGTYNYSGMLRDQIAGKNQSWAVRWYASALLNDKLSLYPGKTLVQHIGSDGSGTHCADNDAMGLFAAPVCQQPVNIDLIDVEENVLALNAFCQFLKQIKPSLMRRVIRRLRNWVNA